MASYKRLSEDSLLREYRDDEEGLPVQRPLSWTRFHVKKFFWTIQALLFSLSITMLLSGIHLHRVKHACHDEDFLPMWSPILGAVQGTGHFTRFDGSFATPNAFKGTPNPDIDQSWDGITYADGGVISITEETLHAVNGSHEYSVKLAEELGGGYMASVEVLHQLHCLNMLRQATYEDYYKDKAEPWEDSPEILRYHLDHCIDNLRQKLMCEADTGILTYVWVKDHPAPFPDFNVQHKCRNFDSIKQWVQERQIYTHDGIKIKRQPGYRELQSPP